MVPRFVLKQPPEEDAVVCVVCHGHYDERDPDLSGLLVDRQLGVISRFVELRRDTYYQLADMPLTNVPFSVSPAPGQVAELLSVAELKTGFEANTLFEIS